MTSLHYYTRASDLALRERAKRLRTNVVRRVLHSRPVIYALLPFYVLSTMDRKGMSIMAAVVITSSVVMV